jgi:hypothetical protein
VTRAIAWLREGDRWIPGIFVLAFLLLFAVNGRMVAIAFANRPELVNRPAATALPATGATRLAIIAPADARAGEPFAVSVRIAAPRGKPALAEGAVTLTAERPTRYAQKKQVPLTAQDGAYRASLTLPLGGEWVLTAVAATDDGPVATSVTLDLLPGTRP